MMILLLFSVFDLILQYYPLLHLPISLNQDYLSYTFQILFSLKELFHCLCTMILNLQTDNDSSICLLLYYSILNLIIQPVTEF